MEPKRVGMMMRIVEIAWLAVAAICVVELYFRWNDKNNQFWMFAGALVIAVVMFFFRKKQRLNYIRRHQDDL